MKKFLNTRFRDVAIAGSVVISLTNFVLELFGEIVPQTVMSFFKDISVIIVVAAVFVFAFVWLLKSRPPNKPKNYSIITYDVFGRESDIDGLRIRFRNHDVAWSFMKQYKKYYPLYNFALVSDNPRGNKKTIFRYI